MIEYIEGNIFHSPAQVIVNTVNTVGVMGKGLALSFKKRYPAMFDAYQKACDKHQLTIGKLMLYYAPDHWILMFPTKEHWRNPSKLSYLEAGLSKFVSTYADKGITSIAFPKLGCGNGELSWADVQPVMEKYLKPLPIPVYIYLGMDSTQTPEHLAQEENMDWLRKNARDLSFTGLCDDLRHGQTLLPYQVTASDDTYDIHWEAGLAFSSQAHATFHISEAELFDLWDSIREKRIFSIADYAPHVQVFFRLLQQLGYLSAIHLQDENGHMQSGYQINEGYGRMYAVRGMEA